MCGGTLKRCARTLGPRGLSPRVRGNQHLLLVQPDDRGSIPACAGEPKSSGRSSWIARVYPRVCGGTYRSINSQTNSRGLSPRVRGNPPRPSRGQAPPRSIPACAGEPAYPYSSSAAAVVYPRVCGGTNYLGFMAAIDDGLSPRVRGNLPYRHPSARRGGSIPACAGEPQGNPQSLRSSIVYPRVCGGTALAFGLPILLLGLSPRVRGNRTHGRAVHPRRWSIPACAGEPTIRRSASPPMRVYPRVCGGTSRRPAES